MSSAGLAARLAHRLHGATALAAGDGLRVAVARLYRGGAARRGPAGAGPVHDAAELQRSEAMFRSAFDDALAGMTLIDVEGNYLRVNTVFAAMVGRPAQDLVGTSFREVTHEDDLRQDEDAVQQTLSGSANGMRRQKRYRHADGSTVYVELSTSLIRDQDGRPTHYATQYIDVTARRVAERERDTHDLMLRAVIANSQSLVYVKDLDGRYLLANTPLQRVFGATEQELLGKDDSHFDATLAPGWRENDLHAQHGEVRVREWSDGPQGLRAYDSVKFPLYDSDGKVYAICGVSLDVTRSELDAASMAQARDAALEATRAKSSFLATMSHEIRTPMNAVIGLTGLLLDSELDADQRELLETVRSSGDSLLAIINDILNFSKIEAGELTLESQPFGLRECVESAIALLTLSAGTKGLELIADIDVTCPELVVGDITRVRQVIVNLVGNAVKFTAQGAVIVAVTCTPEPDSPSVRLQVAVRDSGIGIPADRLDRLFRSFSQVDDSTTREYGGTGLGLAISHRLAQAMHGDLEVVSETGVGSTFTLTAVLGSGSERRDPLSGPAPLAGRCALVVDDHTVSRRVLRRQLESWGMSCTDCGTSAAALELVSSGDPYDIAVLDMTMPELDGQQLARELRRLPAGRALPLVLLSSVPTRLEADEPPLFAAVLTKPARAKVLQDAITSVLLPTTTVLRALETAGGARSLDGPPAGRPVALRVLLAEDNVVNQMVAQLMLDRSGHHVDTVSNGQEALDALHRRPYDVVLMDMQMPVLDGLTAIRRLRAELPLARQPYVLALTASALVTDRQACAAAGANTFLSKPVQQAELDEALADVVPLQLTEQQPLLAP